MTQVRKTFPQEAIPTVTKSTPRTGKSSFQSRKIPEFHQGTPASKCVSLKDKFDKYITEHHSNLTEDDRKLLWQRTSAQLIENPQTEFITIIEEIIQF
jgi:aminoglycoside phosphotransferase family enzyme